uniref:hypothetical protein n=1 Tax=Microscilla sp. PRE1 TaxID=155537 RepID=UPI00146AD420|nr:hypothetical protein [Microscilla sp. PRE1]
MNLLGRLQELRKLDEVVGSDAADMIMDMKCRIAELEKQKATNKAEPGLHLPDPAWGLLWLNLVMSILSFILHLA